jgi:signal transduction histidine kinase
VAARRTASLRPSAFAGEPAAAHEAGAARQTHDIEELPKTVERLRREVEELRASRRRIVLAGDADRHRIERALHEGVQQDLVALAVNLQVAGALVESDPAGAKQLVDELARDARRSLDETAQLAQRIYPPLLESGGLGAALRAAAVGLGIRASIEVAEGDGYPPEVVRALYFCGVAVLERVGPDGRARLAIRAEAGALAFDVGTDAHLELEDLRDRVEALGGRLTIKP